MPATLPTVITPEISTLYDGQIEFGAATAAAADIPKVEDQETHLARRQYEVNEWTIQNRRDTLFVLQIVFVGLCIGAVLTGLNRKGILGTWLYGLLVSVIILLIVFIIVRRAQYTNFTRDNRYWNRMRFDKAPGPPIITMPSICPGPVNMVNKKEIAGLF
jgi:hypothetical protein